MRPLQSVRSARVRLAEHISRPIIRGLMTASGIDLFLSTRTKQITVDSLSSPNLSSELSQLPIGLLSSDPTFGSPEVEEALGVLTQRILPPETEMLFEPLKGSHTEGRDYANAAIKERQGRQVRLFDGDKLARCPHGLQRGACALCSAPPAGQSTRKRPSHLDPFDLILPILQPPLGTRFDNVFAFGPGQKLYDFQCYGVVWLTERKQALLADEMGLGKSIQAIVALRVLFRQGAVTSSLILCPKSILTDWERKFRIWAPELRIQVVHGSKEFRELQWLSQAHVHLATYESLRQDTDLVSSDRFGLVIVDEVQRIKNPETGIAQSVRRLAPSYRWGLSGTPLENRLDDLVAIFAFLSPGLLRSVEIDNLSRVKKAIEPYLLRRRKAEALKDLPEKVVGESWVELMNSQRIRYDEAEQQGVIDLKGRGEKVTITHVFALINHLKQICNIDHVTGESAKLEFLVPRLEHITEQGDKALIFSQYPGKTLGKVAGALGKFGAQIFDGSLSERERDRVLDAFRHEGERTVLLLSTKAGGLGLTLTEANYVFHMDLWWNPATATQAEDRVHRIGQKKSVFVQYIYAIDTIEERIKKLLEYKRELFRKVIDELSDVTLSKLLTEDELFGLFGLQAPRSVTAFQSRQPVNARSNDRLREELTTLERSLRRFIEKRLSAFSQDWWETAIPADIRERAEGRRVRNEASWPWLKLNPTKLVDYLDFSDYRKIIGRDDNWENAFKGALLHREIVLGKLSELEPIRNTLAHNRSLSTDEQEILLLNAKHLMVLIEKEV